MKLFTQLRSRIGAAAEGKAKRRPVTRFRPRLEVLEDRQMLSAGNLDPTFGSGGTASPASNINGGAAAIAVDSSAHSPTAGDVVVAGNAMNKGAADFAVVRYTPNGTPDTSFGNRGEVLTAFKSYAQSYAFGVGVQPDGKIVAAGVVQGQSAFFALARYNGNGSLDTTFGSGGEVVTPSFTGSGTTASNDYARAELIQPDGKLVVVGETNNGGENAIALARYTSTGKLDSTFGSGGKVITPHTAIPGSLVNGQGGATQVYGAALQADGKILVSGSTEVTGGLYPTYEAFVARYNSDGTLDAGFGSGGVVTLPPMQAGGAGVGHVAVEPGGEIVVSGYGQLALLHSGQAGYADGSFDTAFGGNNTGIAPQGAGQVALEPNGDIVLGEPNYLGGSLITRLLPNGTPDLSFGSAGTVTLSSSPFAALVSQPDGKVDVAFNGQIINKNLSATPAGFMVNRLLPGEPQISSFTSTTNADGSLTLTASQISDDNPNATITRVAFYYFDSNGNKVSLGTGVQDGQGDWTLVVNLPPGTYTLYAQAVDSYSVVGDPISEGIGRPQARWRIGSVS